MKNKTLFIYLCCLFFNLTIIEKEMEAKERIGGMDKRVTI